MVQENLHTFKDFNYVTKTIPAYKKENSPSFYRIFSVMTKKINFIRVKTK